MSSAPRKSSKPSAHFVALPAVRASARGEGAAKAPVRQAPPSQCKRCSRAHSLPAVSPALSGKSQKASPLILKRPAPPVRVESPKAVTTPPAAKTPPEKDTPAPPAAVTPSPEGGGEAAPAQATASEELRRSEEEAQALKAERGNGAVRLVYEMYNEEFSITNGSTTQEAVDQEYALSFVMPQCRVHLSTLAPAEKRNADIAGILDIFVKEGPPGTYQDLEKDCTYYVYVEQEALQLEREQAIARRRAELRGATEEAPPPAVERDDGRVLESCSCIYGNPCLDEYGCRDWSHRFAIAAANGWKGF